MLQKYFKWLIILGLFVAAAAILAACGSPTDATPSPEVTACPQPEAQVCAECPEPETCPASALGSFEDLWANSGHADAEAEAFRHWDDAGEVEVDCAKCHSGAGFQDFVGADGSAPMAVDAPAPTDKLITCDTCHNDATAHLSSVTFPSGVEITGLGREAICMTCHQGRAAGNTVQAQIDEAGLTDEDGVSADLGFTNIHYYAAAVTRYGSVVGGGYQYEGKSYDALFEHVVGYQACQDCHNPHSLEVKVEECANCHEGVATVEDLRNVREISSSVDYDGDGDVTEGISFEIAGLQEMLLGAMKTYSTEVSGAALAYSPTAYPYFMNDLNNDGEVGDDEATGDNAYASWTPRLVKAAYNLQTSIKDPGAFAHGGKYIIELLYDSIESINEAISTPVDLSAAHRIDHGHFAGSEEAFRHWDAEGEVPADCAKCHSAEGLPMFLENGGNVINVEVSNGFRCDTCHNTAEWPARRLVEEVTFPSGATVAFTDKPDANLCISCHQGRESTISVNNKIEGLDKDVIPEKLSFTNVHYFAAGATLFGNDVKGAYQYDGKEYLGQFAHVPGFNTCVDCHDAHNLVIDTAACAGCHGTDDPKTIRGASSTADYDGDGNVTEGMAGEIETELEKLYVALQAYGTDVIDSPVAYGAGYPYWFKDTNANGIADPEEQDSKNAFVFSPRALQAAYNYQYVLKDPGTFAHNGKYILQVLFDSIEDLGTVVDVDMTGMVRP